MTAPNASVLYEETRVHFFLQFADFCSRRRGVQRRAADSGTGDLPCKVAAIPHAVLTCSQWWSTYLKNTFPGRWYLVDRNLINAIPSHVNPIGVLQYPFSLPAKWSPTNAWICQNTVTLGKSEGVRKRKNHKCFIFLCCQNHLRQFFMTVLNLKKGHFLSKWKMYLMPSSFRKKYGKELCMIAHWPT